MGIIHQLVKDTPLPLMIRCRQRFPGERIEPGEIPGQIFAQLNREPYHSMIKPGMEVAITAGSRGICNMPLILKALGDWLRQQGASPFLVPAMGSHGGATAEGQVEVLESLGITEMTTGCPIRATMETVEIARTPHGSPVYIDKYAAGADGIVVTNRIKPHTAYAGPYGSGIMKMMTIGLGKQKGADTCHSYGFEELSRLVHLYGQAILDHAPVLFALGILENPRDETYKLAPMTPGAIPRVEPLLQQEAREQMPRIYLPGADILVVDHIGKEYTGFCMDPNVTGRAGSGFDLGGLKPQRLVALDLSDASHGNAEGVGMADFITRRLQQKIDTEQLYANAVTALSLRGAYLPIVAETDQDAVQVAVKACVGIDRRNPKIIRINNTLGMEEIRISTALAREAEAHPNITLESEPEPWAFVDGELTDRYRQ